MVIEMSKKIRLSLTPKEWKELEHFARDRIKDYIHNKNEKSASMWREISEHIKNKHLSDDDIREIIHDLYSVIYIVYLPNEEIVDSELDDIVKYYTMIKKLGKYII